MADTTALKNRICAAIKANDNQEITGPVLQQALLDMVDELNGATETEASQRQSGDSTLQQGINTERQARIDADNTLGQRITEAFDDLDMIDAAGSEVSPNAIDLTLRKNDGSDQDPEWRTLCQLLIPSATNQRAGLMSAAMQNLLYNLRNAGYAFGGIAVTGTNPGVPTANCFYIVRGTGTYTHFKNADNESIVLENDGIYVFTYESVENNYWEWNPIIGIDDVPTAGSKNLVESGGVEAASYTHIVTKSLEVNTTGNVRIGTFSCKNAPIKFCIYVISNTAQSLDDPNLYIRTTDGMTKLTGCFASGTSFLYTQPAGASQNIVDFYIYALHISVAGEITIRVTTDDGGNGVATKKIENLQNELSSKTQVAESSDFNSPTAVQKRHILTVGTMSDIADSEPVENSIKPIKSGAVFKSIHSINNSLDSMKDENATTKDIEGITVGMFYKKSDGTLDTVQWGSDNYRYLPIAIESGVEYRYSGNVFNANIICGVIYTDSNNNIIGRECETAGNYSNELLHIPNGASYILACGRGSFKMTIKKKDYKFLEEEDLEEMSSDNKIEVSVTKQEGKRLGLNEVVDTSTGCIAVVAIDHTKTYYLKTRIDQYRYAAAYFRSSEIIKANCTGNDISFPRPGSAIDMEGFLTIPADAAYMVVCSADSALLKLYEVIPSDKYVSSDQPVGNIGKYLYVNENGKVATKEIPEASEVLENAVIQKISKTLYLGENVLSGTVGSGTGWSESDGVYTHATGNTAALDFALNTDSGDAYVAILNTGISNFAEGYVNVSIGNNPLCDIYNGSTGPYYIGMVSDGGHLKITPASGYNSTVYGIELRKIVSEEDAVTSVIITQNNVQAGTMDADITSWWNVAIGADDALNKLQNGSRNIAIGTHSSANLQSGERNIGIGTFSLNQLVHGVRNIAIGADALYRVGEASDNIAIGKAAAGKTYQNPADHIYQKNIAIGTDALSTNAKDCIGNVIIGHRSGVSSVTNNDVKQYNVAIGEEALTTGVEHNVAIGYRAGYYTQGSRNVHVGSRTNKTYVTGSDNVFIGDQAYASNGTESSSNIVTIDNAIAIGSGARATKSNQVVIGNAYHTEFVLGTKKIIFNPNGNVEWETIS